MKHKDEKSRKGGFLWKCLALAVFLSGALAGTAQQREITGTVSDANGPLAGVAVTVRGTTQGTTTNAQGRYVIRAASTNTLEFSFIGYVPQSVPVGNRTRIDIAMKEDVKAIDEVVVIGYGTVSKGDLTGSVVAISGAELTEAPTNNIMEALQGKISGMDIMKPSGAVGSDVDVLLRGTRSIYGSNEPLYIIDGIPGGYSQINSQDVESVTVLKDASSTAIYGSAGANGVVIITTKKGKGDKLNVNFDAYAGFSGNASFLHGMQGDEFLRYQSEYYRTKNDAYPEDITQLFTNEYVLQAIQDNKWIDWVDVIIGGRAVQQKYNLSVSSGGEKTKIYSSFTYSKEEGMLSNENLSRYGGRFNIEHTIRPWVKFGSNVSLAYNIKNARSKNIFTKALKAFPLGDVYDADGNYNVEFIDGETTPLGDELENQFADENRSTSLNVNAYVDFLPFKGLTFRTMVGGYSNAARGGKYIGKSSTQGVESGYVAPYTYIANNYGYGYSWQNIPTYQFEVAKDHKFEVTGLMEWKKSQSDNNNMRADGQALDYYLFHNIGAAIGNKGVTSHFSQTQSLSFAGRINYSYKGRYLATFTNRWDGASHLAEGHKWEMFPAGAIAWRISSERFMERTRTWLDDLKLRVSYGVTGNSGGMGAYSSQTGAVTYNKVSADGQVVHNAQMVAPYANPSIGWEKSYSLDVGLDVALLKNRITLAVDWYDTDTKDLLFKRTLPITAAITAWGSPLQMWQNIGQTNNRGYEITLTTRNIVHKDFTWTTSVSFTHNKEKIVSLPDGDLVASKLFEGHPVKTHYDYKYLGLWSSAEAEEAAKYGCQPGGLKIATQEKFDADGVGDNGYHTYSETDKQILGSNTPDGIIGFSNKFTWRNFDLNIFAMARYGQMIRSSLLGWYDAGSKNQPEGIDYWLPETNEGAYFPRPGISNTTGISSLTYVDGSFIKIKNITLGYSLPDKLLKKAGITNLRVYATAYNPFIIPIKGVLKHTDPENNGSDTFPLYKTYVFGINFSF